MSETIADGIWIKMPDGQHFKLPGRPEYPEVGFEANTHWTEHLCVVGMGTHYQYGQCQSQYQFTALYDASDSLVGVVNALNLQKKLDMPPELIEVIPSSNLLGLVFNESRFDPCYNLVQPRIFIHVYLKIPEVEYQSCVPPTLFTPMNDQTKRCNLCFTTLKSLLGTKCAGDGLSMECCCGISSLSNQVGGCRDQGCALPSECDDYDSGKCHTVGSVAAARGSATILTSLLVYVSWVRLL